MFLFPRTAVTKQTMWLKAMQVYFIIVWMLETWNQAMLPETLHKICACLFPSFRWCPWFLHSPWLTVASLQLIPLSSHGHLSICLCLHMVFFSSYNDTSCTVLGFHNDFGLTWFICKIPISKQVHIFRYLGLEIQCVLIGAQFNT